ncbi:MAG: hypothetical protein KAU95_04735, partial [Candidatus Aenigmarchaeota archaeon]|nr:hypothetical protein [Candidatus Aenigmarchaeota archaeon]
MKQVKISKDFKEELAQAMIDKGVVSKGEVDLKYGGSSEVYFYVKKILGEPELLNKLADYSYSLFPEETNCVCGEGLGGLPLASAISSKYGLKLVSVRLDEKDHGLKNKIEFYRPSKTDKVAIVDDVLSTGTSLKNVVSALEECANISCCCVVVVDREDVKKIKEYSEDKIYGYPLEHLFKSGDRSGFEM